MLTEPMYAEMLVRLAKPDECDALTALAMRAKASWGYPDDFMAACQLELTMTQARIAAWTVWVAESDQTICGMIALNLKSSSDKAEIEEFFVDPNFHRRGIGRNLMSTLLESCLSCGVKAVGLDANPYAEGIYNRLGFATVGRSPSRSNAAQNGTTPRPIASGGSTCPKLSRPDGRDAGVSGLARNDSDQ